MRKRFNGKVGGVAISQILILILGTIAIAYIAGSEIGFVSAVGSLTQGQICCTPNGIAASLPGGVTCPPTSDPCTSGLSCQKIGGITSTTYTCEPTSQQTNSPTCAQQGGEWTSQSLCITGGITASDATSSPMGSQSGYICCPINQQRCNTQNNGATIINCPSGYTCMQSPGSSRGLCQQTGITVVNGQTQPAPAPSQNPPSVTGNIPSGTVGNSLVQQCTQIFGSGEALINCLNGVSSTVSSLGGTASAIKSGVNAVTGAASGLGPTGAFGATPASGLTAGSGATNPYFSGAVGKFFGPFFTKFWNAVKGPLAVTGEIVGAATAAYGFYQLTHWLVNMIPGYDPNSTGAAWVELGTNLLAGGVVFPGTLGLEQIIFNGGSSFLGLGFWPWAGIGAGVALAWFFVSYQQHTVKAVQFSCIPWQAPLGGNDCSKCGENGLPCSAYQCASLGLNCMLLNANTNGPQLCAAVNQNNLPPVMSFWNDILTSGYSASPLGVSVISSKGDTGVQITSNQSDGNVPAYANLLVGVQTDKASVCGFSLSRIDIKDSSGNDTFSQLNLMDNGLYEYNHTLFVPSGVQPQNGTVEIYVRCHDSNDPADYTPNYFIIRFGMEPVQDHSAPIILGTDIPNNAPVPYGTSSVNVSLYISKAVSACRWSHSAQAYEDMPSANLVDCSMGAVPITSGLQMNHYRCVANLTGIQNNQVNTFYFRCNDTLGDVNTANPPFTFSLQGSQQTLAINSASPNNTLIKGASDSIKVTLNVQTVGGTDGQGTAICYYNDTVSTNRYLAFSNTNSYQSSQDLWLPTGSYTFPIKCVDSAGDAAYTMLNFSVQTDNMPPNVVRAYHDTSTDSLTIQTDENATCSYDINSCLSVDQGTAMSSVDGGITHSAGWVSGRMYYITCEDQFGNQPATNQCSIILSAS
ncbi:MAG: hypothetical protein KGH55_02720 [Nanoarchaeota archaeon]|nr:hypothetical protein [Nanoarchaeota archaeon]